MRSMIVEIDKALPGVLNQNSVERIKKEHDATLSGEMSWTGWDPIEVVVIGESIAYHIGQMWKEEVDDINQQSAGSSFPSITIWNLGIPGSGTISYFICSVDHNPLCDIDNRYSEVKRIFSLKTKVAVLHDQSFSHFQRCGHNK